MLRKRSRSIGKDQQQQMGHLAMSDDVLGHNSSKSSSFFSVPGLFVGLSSKALIDCDSVRSPTSPLDFRVFSNLGSPFRSPKSNCYDNGGHQQRSWGGGSSKVGLISIIDDDFVNDVDVKKMSGKVAAFSESKNILFGPNMKIKTLDSKSKTDSFASPKSLPKNYAVFPHSKTKSPLEKGGSSVVVFEIGEAPSEPDSFGKIRSCSLDSGGAFSTLSALSGLSNLNPNSTSGNFALEKDLTTQPFIGGSANVTAQMTTGSLGSSNGFVGSLSASEMELSEDYTCVISHGANPKTTHIFGDCILGCHSKDMSNFGKEEEKEIGFACPGTSLRNFVQYPSNNFLSFCYYCNKKLEEGKDIYIYKGEKAFCSLSCRSEEILIDDELEKCNDQSSEKPLESDEELFETGTTADK